MSWCKQGLADKALSSSVLTCSKQHFPLLDAQRSALIPISLISVRSCLHSAAQFCLASEGVTFVLFKAWSS
jgi:hypothetical protein